MNVGLLIVALILSMQGLGTAMLAGTRYVSCFKTLEVYNIRRYKPRPRTLMSWPKRGLRSGAKGDGGRHYCSVQYMSPFLS